MCLLWPVSEERRIATESTKDTEVKSADGILARMEIDQIPEYMLEPMSLTELIAFVNDLKLALAERAYPEDSSGTAAPSGHN